MGTRVAPTFANLFMEKLEKKMLDTCPQHLKQYIVAWKRYIDDVMLIFSGTYKQFDELMCFLNNVHKTIKFDIPNHNKLDNSCNFLDTKISIRPDIGEHVDSVVHVRTLHEQVKKFKCDKCEYVTSQNEDLKLHIEEVHVRTLHEQVKKFKCDKCDYVTSQNEDLKLHIEDSHNTNVHNIHIHQKLKDATCNLFPSITIENCDLEGHIKKDHKNDTRFQCVECLAKFSCNSSLKRHVKDEHENCIMNNEDYNKCIMNPTNMFKKWIITTNLYRKETDKPRALLPSSFHPGHISKNIVYSMAFRLLRICSLEKDFENNLDILKKDFLTPRGYKSNLINEQFKRIRELPGDTYSIKRKLALEKKKHQKDDSDRVIAPFNFEPLLVNLRSTLKKHHNAMVFRNESLKIFLKNLP